MDMNQLIESDASDAQYIIDTSGETPLKIIQRGLDIDGESLSSVMLVTIGNGAYKGVDTSKHNPKLRFYRVRTLTDTIDDFIKSDEDDGELLVSLSNDMCDALHIDAGMRDTICFADFTEVRFEVPESDRDCIKHQDQKYTIIDGEIFGYDEYLIAHTDKIAFV